MEYVPPWNNRPAFELAPFSRLARALIRAFRVFGQDVWKVPIELFQNPFKEGKENDYKLNAERG